MRLIIILILSLLFACGREKEGKQVEGKTEPVTEELPPIDNKEAVSFVYHRFGDDRFPSTNVSTRDFETHLTWLANHNYQVLNLTQAIEYIKSGQQLKRTAVITIDDGYKSFYEKGLPLLVKYKMPATLFINTETVGAGDYMNWKELKDAAGKNIEIGNHTHSHAYFLNEKATVRYTTFVNEIESSQKAIEENLQVTPAVFAYPYGEFDEEMKTIVKAIGFKGAAAQNSGVINQATDLFQLPRFPMSETYADKFEEKALMRSMNIIRVSPRHGLIPKGKSKPTLRITINPKGLNMDQMQCFVQGSNCKFNIVERTASELTLSLVATTAITNRRRTLYTLTIPDSAGNWHWYSHLWINPTIK